MGWEESLSATFEDLEQQLSGLQLVERDADLAALEVAEYATVTLASRLHASVGRWLRVRLGTGPVLHARLLRAGPDWLLLGSETHEWVVPLHSVVGLEGLSPRARGEQAWSATERLGLRGVLRRLAADGQPSLVSLGGGVDVRARVGRVGEDFVELHDEQRATRAEGPLVVPFAALVALRGDAC